MNTKVLLHCGGGSNLILGTSRGKKFFLTTPAAINFFHQILKNCQSGVKKKIITHTNACIAHIWSPILFLRGILIFQGVLTKFNFSMKFPHLEKNCRFNEIPKI